MQLEFFYAQVQNSDACNEFYKSRSRLLSIIFLGRCHSKKKRNEKRYKGVETPSGCNQIDERLMTCMHLNQGWTGTWSFRLNPHPNGCDMSKAIWLFSSADDSDVVVCRDLGFSLTHFPNIRPVEQAVGSIFCWNGFHSVSEWMRCRQLGGLKAAEKEFLFVRLTSDDVLWEISGLTAWSWKRSPFLADLTLFGWSHPFFCANVDLCPYVLEIP